MIDISLSLYLSIPFPHLFIPLYTILKINKLDSFQFFFSSKYKSYLCR